MPRSKSLILSHSEKLKNAEGLELQLMEWNDNGVIMNEFVKTLMDVITAYVNVS
jgi:hypothetical protein